MKITELQAPELGQAHKDRVMSLFITDNSADSYVLSSVHIVIHINIILGGEFSQ